MKTSIRTALSLLAVCFMAATSAWAQPDPANQGKGDNPPPRQKPAPAAADPARPDQPGKGSTPAERQAKRLEAEKKRQDRIRQMLQRVAVSDADQELVIKYVQEREQERQALSAEGRKLTRALRADGPPEAQLLTMVNDFQASLEAAAAHRKDAAQHLDEKIGYSKNPRLHAVLLLMGIVGDAPTLDR